MKKNKIFQFIFIFLPIVIIGLLFAWPKQKLIPIALLDLPVNNSPRPFSTIQPTATSPESAPAISESQTTHLYQPTFNFVSRVTKKPFGIYITPENSPITPEKFIGWHTGADAEYEDTTSEVAVHAISNGKVRSSRRANGYGGIVVIEHLINNQTLLVIYGHLDPASLVQENSLVTTGQQIGILGDGGTNETDGERKHLHLGILSTTNLDVRGYVNSADELNDWLDPLAFFEL